MTVTTSKANINPVVAVLESRERTSAFFAVSAKVRKKKKKKIKKKEKRIKKKGKGKTGEKDKE